MRIEIDASGRSARSLCSHYDLSHPQTSRNRRGPGPPSHVGKCAQDQDDGWRGTNLGFDVREASALYVLRRLAQHGHRTLLAEIQLQATGFSLGEFALGLHRMQ